MSCTMGRTKFKSRTMKSPSALLTLFPLVFACEGPLPAESPKTAPDQRASFIPVIGAPGTAPAASAAPPATIVFENVGLSTPESVLYDADTDVYIVTNIAGSPDGKDGNGFISLLNPDGTVKQIDWIVSGKNDVVLNAPKGSGLFGGKLWVSDIDHVRRFDVASGKMEAAIEIEGATFLNDIVIGPDGTVYVSDSGVKVGKEGFEPTGTDAIHKIVADEPVTIVKNKSLARPNGLWLLGDHILVVSLGGNVLRELDAKGKEVRKTEIPNEGLDGLVELGDDDYLVTSWQGQAIYRGGFDTPFAAVAENQISPADIGFDTKRNRILIPVFQGDQVRAVPLPEATSASPPSGTAARATSAPAVSATSPSPANSAPSP